MQVHFLKQFAAFLRRKQEPEAVIIGTSLTKWHTVRPVFPSARQLVRQDGGVTAPRAGRGRPGWPMAAHQLASAYKKVTNQWLRQPFSRSEAR